jgi:hypothetical protein
MNSRIYRLVTNIWTKEKVPNEWNSIDMPHIQEGGKV